MIECSSCGNEYTRLGQHLSLGDCDYPEISDYQKQLLTGVLMGDGCIANRDGERPYFVVEMISREFLEWLQSELSTISYSVRQAKTAEESYHSSEKSLDSKLNIENFSETYRFQTIRHPWLNNLAEWYDSGEKKYPDDLQLTPTVAKMWYVTDGGVRPRQPDHHNEPVVIACNNESERAEVVQSMFKKRGFDPQFKHGNVVFSVEESRDFLNWIGDPVPGFQYKWVSYSDHRKPWHDADRLKELYIDQDMSLKEVGAELGCSDATVAKWLRENDLPVKGKHGSFN